MRRLATIGAALAAIAALTAIAASMASAAAPEFSKEKVKFTSFSGSSTLSTVGGELLLVCEKDKDTGEITSKTKIVDNIDIERCKDEGLTGWHSLGDPEGTILTTVTGALCLIKEKDVGILLDPTAEVHVEIPGAATLLLIKGSVTGFITPINRKTLRSELFLMVVEKEQVPDECEGKKDELLTSINGGAFTKSTEATTAVIGYLTSEVEIIE